MASQDLDKAFSAFGVNLPLEEWLAHVYKPSRNSKVITFCFPSHKQRTEYLSHITSRPDSDVRLVLESFLIHSGYLRSDDHAIEWLLDAKAKEPERYAALMTSSHYKRLESAFAGRGEPPWEGITWILDLLPGDPQIALEALNAYLYAHMQFLPDGRIAGLGDAAAVIRAKYIGLPGTFADSIRFLFDQGWRRFECLIERLYQAMGYDTRLTKPSDDGGRDVIARRATAGRREHVVVQCKLYNSAIGVRTIRELHSVVVDQRANKGVLVTTNRFTRGSHRWAKRHAIELIDGETLVPLMNQFLGSQWSLWVERLIREALKPGIHKGRG